MNIVRTGSSALWRSVVLASPWISRAHLASAAPLSVTRRLLATDAAASVADGTDAPKELQRQREVIFLKPLGWTKPLQSSEALRAIRAYACVYDSPEKQNVELWVRLDMVDYENTKKKEKKRDPFNILSTLPFQSRKLATICVFAEGPAALEAREAGADFVGGQDLITQIAEDKKPEYDKFLTVPDMLPQLKQIASILREDMPTQKKGTVSHEIGALVKKFKNGIQFKTDKSGMAKLSIGKLSMTNDELIANINQVLADIDSFRKSFKRFILSISIKAAQGPMFPVQHDIMKTTAQKKKKAAAIAAAAELEAQA